MWPDLANFCQFGKVLKIFKPFWSVYLAFGKIFKQLWLIFNVIEHIFILENSQNWTNYLAIWSHWFSCCNNQMANFYCGKWRNFIILSAILWIMHLVYYVWFRIWATWWVCISANIAPTNHQCYNLLCIFYELSLLTMFFFKKSGPFPASFYLFSSFQYSW